jgi:hypothetical protein
MPTSVAKLITGEISLALFSGAQFSSLSCSIVNLKVAFQTQTITGFKGDAKLNRGTE